MKTYLIAAFCVAAALTLSACDGGEKNPAGEAHAESGEMERGPHRGRMLRDGNFAVEVTIFEDGVEPEFRLYAYRDDKPVAPTEVQVSVQLVRLGGMVDNFTFAPREGYLRGNGVVTEPHSFDVKVDATEGGRQHSWAYQSYEGRTTISAQAADKGGVKTERAGSAMMSELINLSGRVEITPEGRADLRAWNPGRIVEMRGELGQAVRKGQVMARVESSSSLQTYSIPAPIDGVIIEKNANVGDTTEGKALFVVANPSMLHAEFFVYPRDAERVRVGQNVELHSLSGQAQLKAKVEAILPTADLASQTLMAHVHLPASAADQFRPGMGVEGQFEIAVSSAPLAVRTKAIQRFRDGEVVYARVANTYEVRMLEVGRRTPEWTAITGGLEPGTEYVTDGSFLIRADIDKAGASHDH